MAYFLTKDGSYYEGDKVDPADIEVLRRPSPIHKWDGVGAWVQDVVFAAEQARILAIDSAITTDTALAQFKTMTDAEFNAWFAANVTNAAQAIQILKKVCNVIRRRVL